MSSYITVTVVDIYSTVFKAKRWNVQMDERHSDTARTHIQIDIERYSLLFQEICLIFLVFLSFLQDLIHLDFQTGRSTTQEDFIKINSATSAIVLKIKRLFCYFLNNFSTCLFRGSNLNLIDVWFETCTYGRTQSPHFNWYICTISKLINPNKWTYYIKDVQLFVFLLSRHGCIFFYLVCVRSRGFSGLIACVKFVCRECSLFVGSFQISDLPSGHGYIKYS